MSLGFPHLSNHFRMKTIRLTSKALFEENSLEMPVDSDTEVAVAPAWLKCSCAWKAVGPNTTTPRLKAVLQKWEKYLVQNSWVKSSDFEHSCVMMSQSEVSLYWSNSPSALRGQCISWCSWLMHWTMQNLVNDISRSFDLTLSRDKCCWM